METIELEDSFVESQEINNDKNFMSNGGGMSPQKEAPLAVKFSIP